MATQLSKNWHQLTKSYSITYYASIKFPNILSMSEKDG